MALVKYNNNSISSITAVDSLPAGGLNLISTSTVSSSVSEVDITSGIDSTYDTYVFKFINIHPSNDHAIFGFNLRDGGSNFDATITSTSFYSGHNESNSATGLTYNSGQDLAQSTNQKRLGDTGNANDESLCCTMYLFNPSSTTFVKHFIATIACTDGYDYAMHHFNAGYANVTAAIDGIRFTFSAGTIDAGTIKMYGLSKS
jgi:hypothetical protein